MFRSVSLVTLAVLVAAFVSPAGVAEAATKNSTNMICGQVDVDGDEGSIEGGVTCEWIPPANWSMGPSQPANNPGHNGGGSQPTKAPTKSPTVSATPTATPTPTDTAPQCSVDGDAAKSACEVRKVIWCLAADHGTEVLFGATNPLTGIAMGQAAGLLCDSAMDTVCEEYRTDPCGHKGVELWFFWRPKGAVGPVVFGLNPLD